VEVGTQHNNGGDGSGRPARTWSRMRAIAAIAALATVAGIPALAGQASAAPAGSRQPGAAKGTEIATAVTAFGRALVVGSGKYAGFTLYYITSDHGSSFGCTSKPVKTPVGTLLCTGPSGDKQAEWPAITTSGKPVAGPGVSQKLLGTVHRAGIGSQITYAGHPLYLFEDSPGQVTGEGWDEPSLPPWHGVWYLMAPSGRALPWAGTLTTMKIKGKSVLATPMFTGVGWINFPVYSYSRDTARHSRCAGACARAWPPVLTSGLPGLSGGLSPRRLATLRNPDGIQVSYRGKPLYLFAFEGLAPTSTGFGATGNGNGISVGGGTFRLVRA
jgi:predicted lipoprotein with Yx(FWY)xxD motif